MRFIGPMTILSCLELTPAAKQFFVAVVAAAGIGVLALGSRPTAADEPEAVAPAAKAQAPEMSARERRREERRRSRDEETPAAEVAATPEVVDPNAPLVFVVAVQPEMECRRIAVVGSRVPKEVCTPVGQREADEHEAQDFLRRTRERSTMAVPCAATNPALPGPAAVYCGP
jgi:hypothetical protein